MTPEQRIKHWDKLSKETWLVDESFICEGCGETFRYKSNLKKHCDKCLEYKYGKQ